MGDKKRGIIGMRSVTKLLRGPHATTMVATRQQQHLLSYRQQEITRCTPGMETLWGEGLKTKSMLVNNFIWSNGVNALQNVKKAKFSTMSDIPGDKGKGEKNSAVEEKVDEIVDESKLTLFQRFKKMYKEYWYVLIPVHGITSAVWFGSFFYAAKSGLDIVPVLEWMSIPEKYIAPVRGSAAGHVAVAYAMYKVATPLRYTVTLGGATVSINYLKKLGYIKPVPTARRFKEMYDEKRLKLRKRREEIQARIRATRQRLRKRMKRRPKVKTESQNQADKQ